MENQYKVITPDGNIISVEEYMKTDDYHKKLGKQISSFITHKKEKELMELFNTNEKRFPKNS